MTFRTCASKRLARLGAIALCSATCAFAWSLAPSYAIAATSAEMQSQLDAARADLKKMNSQVASAVEAYESAQAELDQTQSDIESVQTQIQENEAELAQVQQSLKGNVTYTYKNKSDMLAVIFGSTTFSDFISSLYYAQTIAADQQQAVSRSRELQTTLASQKAELEQKLADQQTQTAALSDTVNSLSAAQAQQQAYVDGLSAEVQAALEAERQAELEAQRQAALEAAQNPQQGAPAEDAGANNGANSDSGNNNAGNSNSGNNGSNNSNAGNNNNNSNNNNSNNNASNNTPQTPSRPSVSTGGKQGAVEAALTRIGCDYVTNASGPNAFDCSGLVWWAYQQAGISIPRSQRSGMYPRCRSNGTWTTNVYDLVPGDLVFYGRPGAPTHVAMYIGGGRIVHANYGGVEVRSYNYSSSFLGGGSIL